MGVEKPDMADWFGEHELELCPSCLQRKLLPPRERDALRVCVECGVLEDADDDRGARDGTPAVTAHHFANRHETRPTDTVDGTRTTDA